MKLLIVALLNLCAALPTWTDVTASQGSPAPGPLAAMCSARRDVDNTLWIFGGDSLLPAYNGINPSNLLWALKSDGTWTRQGQSSTLTPPARFGCVMVWDSVNDAFLVWGGTAGWPNFLNDLWQFKVSTGQWSAFPAGGGSNRTWGCGAVDAQARKMVVFGGYNSIFSNETGVFDLQQMSWSMGQERPLASYGMPCVFRPTDRAMYVWGGRINPANPETFTNQQWKYDIAGNQWTQVSQQGTLPKARRYVSLIFNQQNDTYYVFGGIPHQDTLSTVDVFSFASSSWTQLTPSGPVPTTVSMNRGALADACNLLYFGGGNATDNGVLPTMWKLTLCVATPAGNCTDGVMNGDEVAVDCGGSCPACQTYVYDVGPYGNCSVSCGGGVQNRTVTCVNGQTGQPAPGMCTAHEPENTTNCNPDPCATYSWNTSNYGACSTTCGGGNATRTVLCISSLGMVVVPDSSCPTPRPIDYQSCNTQNCTMSRWVAGPWGACSANCSGGQQTRTVACQDVNNLPAVDCTGAQPPSTQACNQQACSTNTWFACPDFYPCTAQCNGGTGMLGIQYKDVYCRDSAGTTVDPLLCDANTKPASLIASCNPQPCTGPNWMANGNWGACAAKSPGSPDYIRTRSFHCHSKDGAITVASDCTSPKPIAELPCVPNTCLVVPQPTPVAAGANAVCVSGIVFLLFLIW